MKGKVGWTILDGPGKGQSGIVEDLEEKTLRVGNRDRKLLYITFDREVPPSPNEHKNGVKPWGFVPGLNREQRYRRTFLAEQIVNGMIGGDPVETGHRGARPAFDVRGVFEDTRKKEDKLAAYEGVPALEIRREKLPEFASGHRVEMPPFSMPGIAWRSRWPRITHQGLASPPRTP